MRQFANCPNKICDGRTEGTLFRFQIIRSWPGQAILTSSEVLDTDWKTQFYTAECYFLPDRILSKRIENVFTEGNAMILLLYILGTSAPEDRILLCTGFS